MSLVIILVLVLTTVACSSGSQSSKSSNGAGSANKSSDSGSKKVTLTLWRHTGKPTEDTYYKKLVQSFNASHPNIHVKETAFPDNTYPNQIHAAALSKKMPDIIDMDSTEMAYMVYNGLLAPLDSYISPQLKNDLLPSVIKEGTYKDGKMYLLGQFDSGLAFWANKSYLEKAGVRIPKGPNDAWTGDEFKQALAKLQALPQVKYALNMKVNYGGSYWIYSYLPIVKSFGGDFMNRKTHLTEGSLNSADSVKAWSFLQWAVKKGYVNPNQTSDDDTYGSKISALSLVGHWMTPVFEKKMPKNGILVPLPNFGHGEYTGIGSYAWGITSKAKDAGKAKAAYEFLKYAMSAKEVKDIFKANGAVPARKSVLKTIPEYQKGGKLYLYRQQLEGGHGYPRPITPAFDVLQKQIGKAATDILSGANVKSTLDKAAKTVDQNIKQSGYNK